MGKPPKHGMGFSQHFVVPQNMESAQPKWTSMCQNPRTYNILQHYLIVRKSSGKTKGLVYLKKTRLQIFFCVSQRDFPMDFSHSPALIPVMVTGVPASAVLATPRPSSWMVSWKTPKNALGAPPYDLGNPHEP